MHWFHFEIHLYTSILLIKVFQKLKKKKRFSPWKKSTDKPGQRIKSRDITLPTKVWLVKAMVFLVIELNYKEGWVQKNWCFWIVVLEKTLESPLDCKEIKPVNSKGNQPWLFLGSAEAEAPIIWPPDAKSQLIGKTLRLGKIEGRRRRGDRGWDGWMASWIQRTWVWVNSRS